MPAKKYNECIKYKLLSLTNGFHNQLNQLICKSVQPTCSIHSSSVVTLAGLIPIILQIHCISPTSGHHFLLTHYFQHPLLLYSFTTGLKLTFHKSFPGLHSQTETESFVTSRLIFNPFSLIFHIPPVYDSQ